MADRLVCDNGSSEGLSFLRICWMPSPSSARLRLTSAMSVGGMWTASEENGVDYVCDRGAGGCRRVPMRAVRTVATIRCDSRCAGTGAGSYRGASEGWRACVSAACVIGRAEAARLHCPGQVRRRLLLPPHGACEVLADRGASQPPALIPADDERAPSRHFASRHRPPRVNRARELDTLTFTPTTSRNGPQSPLLERPR
jgi:hypothetical protein